jgi:hypothetical protein
MSAIGSMVRAVRSMRDRDCHIVNRFVDGVDPRGDRGAGLSMDDRVDIDSEHGWPADCLDRFA